LTILWYYFYKDRRLTAGLIWTWRSKMKRGLAVILLLLLELIFGSVCADTPKGVFFTDLKGNIVPESQLIDVTWNIEDVKLGFDLTKADNPEAFFVVVRPTEFDTPIDEAAFYYGEDEWGLDDLKKQLEGDTFYPEKIYTAVSNEPDP